MVNVISDAGINADEEFERVWKQSWCILRYGALMSYGTSSLGEDMGKIFTTYLDKLYQLN
jgi:hypothetical protein